MMKVRQYEVWMAELNPRMGTEPGKMRPVVVVQTDLLNRHHPSTLVCPVTSNVQPMSTLLRVHLSVGEGGVSEACDVMMDQLRAIDNRRLVKKLGKLPPEAVDKVKVNLKIVLDLL
jgi:mRNA interferase MazF